MVYLGVKLAEIELLLELIKDKPLLEALNRRLEDLRNDDLVVDSVSSDPSLLEEMAVTVRIQ